MALKARIADKPIPGVGAEDSARYNEVSEFMLANVASVLDKADKELELEADTKGEAEQYAGYARAWGKRQDPALEIRRIQARNGQPQTIVRLTVKTFDPDAPRPGRPANNPAPAPAAPATPAETPAEVPAPAPAEAATDGKGKGAAK